MLKEQITELARGECHAPEPAEENRHADGGGKCRPFKSFEGAGLGCIIGFFGVA